jgi:hypothetical protein
MELAEHEGFEVPYGVVPHWSPGALFVEVFPEGGMDGRKIEVLEQ